MEACDGAARGIESARLRAALTYITQNYDSSYGPPSTTPPPNCAPLSACLLAHPVRERQNRCSAASQMTSQTLQQHTSPKNVLFVAFVDFSESRFSFPTGLRTSPCMIYVNVARCTITESASFVCFLQKSLVFWETKHSRNRANSSSVDAKVLCRKASKGRRHTSFV